MVLLLLLFLGLTSASVCPTYSCSSELPNDICATRLDYQTFQLNSNGCSGSSECSVFTLNAWTWNSDSITYACAPVYDYFRPAVNWTIQVCPPMQENKGFKNYAQNMTCYSDSDCELQDGTFTQCLCVFRTDGMGVCNPDPSDPVIFAGYWDRCRANDWHISDQKEYMYWAWYREHWAWAQSTVDCAGMFWELDKLQYLQGEYETAAKAGLAGLLLLTGFL